MNAASGQTAEPPLRMEVRDGVGIITINRPDRRNALSRALIAALGDAFRHAADDPAARCVILTGNGPAFCAGMLDATGSRRPDTPPATHPSHPAKPARTSGPPRSKADR